MRIELYRQKHIHIHFHITGESLDVRAVLLKNLPERFRINEMKTPLMTIEQTTKFIAILVQLCKQMDEQNLTSAVIHYPDKLVFS